MARASGDRLGYFDALEAVGRAARGRGLAWADPAVTIWVTAPAGSRTGGPAMPHCPDEVVSCTREDLLQALADEH
ncbi:hypothetical protein [Pseudarthrobacter sp. H2]|uniref:hypothetical protein n=1 Tax=Pseudarthrobacter sp. H2 TaxID=3418415 RepID=UPI003CF5331F